MGNALYARSRLRRGDEALGLHGQGTENSDGINGGSSESRSSWRMIPDSFSGSIWMLDVSRKQAINYRQIKKAIQEELDDRVLRDDDSSTGFQNMLERISELPPKSIHDEAQKALSKWLKDDRVKCLQNREDLKSIDLHGWLLYGDTPCGKFIVQAAIKSRQFILHNMVERVLQKSSSNSMHEKNVLFAENTRKISKANHVSDAEKFGR